MTFRNVGREMWAEAKKVFNNPKLRLKDLRHWSTSEAAIRGNMEAGEVVALVYDEFWVCILKTHDKRLASQPTEET